MVLLSLAYHTEVISGYNIYIYIYMGVLYCYLIVCWSSVLIPSPVSPLSRNPIPGRLVVNIVVCKASVV